MTATLAIDQPVGRTRTIAVAAIAIVVLNVLDIITTKIALNNGATEGNPIANLFVHYLPIFIAIKILIPGTVAYRAWTIRDKVTPMILAGMWWVVGVYSMVFFMNTLHIILGS